MRTLVLGGAALALLGLAGVVVKIQPEAVSVPSRPRHGGSETPARTEARQVEPTQAHAGSSLRLLFIHHSTGRQLLADAGPEETATTHPNGGGLRRLLTESGYRVGTLTYGSRLGEKTDLFDWPPKFAHHMNDLLRTEDQDRMLPEGQQNDIVMFKSCFPNNLFESVGEAPGNPQGPDLTVENAKAALRSLLPHFGAHPDKLFVYLTAPPLAPKAAVPERAWKWLLRKARGRSTEAAMARQAELARGFNDWVADRHKGWLAGYPHANVAVIDYYDLLTGDRASNFLIHPTGDGSDSHPSSEGQRNAAPRVLAGIRAAAQQAKPGRNEPGAAD